MNYDTYENFVAKQEEMEEKTIVCIVHTRRNGDAYAYLDIFWVFWLREKERECERM